MWALCVMVRELAVPPAGCQKKSDVSARQAKNLLPWGNRAWPLYPACSTAAEGEGCVWCSVYHIVNNYGRHEGSVLNVSLRKEEASGNVRQAFRFAHVFGVRPS